MKLETQDMLSVVFLFALFVWAVSGAQNLVDSKHLLWLVLLFGAGISVLLRYEQTKLTLPATVLIWALGLVSGFLLFAKTRMNGPFDYVLATLVGAFVVLAGYLLFTDHASSVRSYLPASRRTAGFSMALIAGMLLAVVLDIAVLRILFGALYTLFLPGFILSYALMGEKELETAERIALSIALSVAIVSVVVFYLQVIGVTISLLSLFLSVLLVCVLGSILAIKKEGFRRYVA